MVEYLEIFGEEYPVRIGYYVMKKVKEETNMPFDEALKKAQEEGKIEIHETILFHALKMGAYAEHQDMDKVPFEKDEMPMVLDDCFAPYITLFTSESFFPEELQETAEEVPQSKQNGKKTSKKKRTKKPQK